MSLFCDCVVRSVFGLHGLLRVRVAGNVAWRDLRTDGRHVPADGWVLFSRNGRGWRLSGHHDDPHLRGHPDPNGDTQHRSVGLSETHARSPYSSSHVIIIIESSSLLTSFSLLFLLSSSLLSSISIVLFWCYENRISRRLYFTSCHQQFHNSSSHNDRLQPDQGMPTCNVGQLCNIGQPYSLYIRRPNV